MAVIYTWIALAASVFTIARAQSIPNHLNYSIEEEQPVGSFVGDVKQDTRKDYDVNQRRPTTSFHFLSPKPQDFGIDNVTGIIRTLRVIDRETLCGAGLEVCELPALSVAVRISTSGTDIVKISIVVVDLNDNSPRWPDPIVHLSVSESAATGFILALPRATDKDSPRFGITGYELNPASVSTTIASSAFSLEVLPTNARLGSPLISSGSGSDVSSGPLFPRLKLLQPLDRETVSSYRVEILAREGGGAGLVVGAHSSALLVVNITVTDSNDNRPKFEEDAYNATVFEDATVGSRVIVVRATDVDEGRNGQVVYEFEQTTREVFGATFRIDNATGEIVILKPLDYERAKKYILLIVAFDRGHEPQSSQISVAVEVKDVNDNAPEIVVSHVQTSDQDFVEVIENAPQGTFVAQINAVDKDSGLSGQFDCTMNDDRFSFHRLGEGNYHVLTARILDRETRADYNLVVICQDRAPVRPLSTVKNIEVRVKDENDNAPKFDRVTYEASVPENSAEGTALLRLNATDLDVGENGRVVYYTAPNLRGVLPGLRSISHTTPDQRYFLPGGDFPFSVDPLSGVIRTSKPIDREQTPSFSFTVIAVDNNDGRESGGVSFTSSALIVINIEDVNDETPKFSQPVFMFGVSEDANIGDTVGNVTAIDLDAMAPYNLVTYSWIQISSDASPDYGGTFGSGGTFGIDSKTGTIFVRAPLDRESTAVYVLRVSAKDGGSPALVESTNVTVYVHDVNDNAPSFLYPAYGNNTVYISNQVEPGQIVARVLAIDADAGRNAVVRYAIVRSRGANGGSDDLFSVDKDSGAILTNQHLTYISHRLFELELVAEDGGLQRLSSPVVILYIVVNESVVYVPADRQQLQTAGNFLAFLGGPTFAIVLTLVCVTLVVGIVLSVAIICLRRQYARQRKAYRYNCRMEAARMISSTEGIYAMNNGKYCGVDSAGDTVMTSLPNGHQTITAGEDGEFSRGMCNCGEGGGVCAEELKYLQRLRGGDGATAQDDEDFLGMVPGFKSETTNRRQSLYCAYMWLHFSS